MEIKEEVTKTVTTKEVKDIICNKCGLSLKSVYYHNNYLGLVEQRVNGKYGSTHLEDGVSYKFSLCEACIAILFATFIHKPETCDIVFV